VLARARVRLAVSAESLRSSCAPPRRSVPLRSDGSARGSSPVVGHVGERVPQRSRRTVLAERTRVSRAQTPPVRARGVPRRERATQSTGNPVIRSLRTPGVDSGCRYPSRVSAQKSTPTNRTWEPLNVGTPNVRAFTGLRSCVFSARCRAATASLPNLQQPGPYCPRPVRGRPRRADARLRARSLRPGKRSLRAEPRIC